MIKRNHQRLNIGSFKLVWVVDGWDLASERTTFMIKAFWINFEYRNPRSENRFGMIWWFNLHKGTTLFLFGTAQLGDASLSTMNHEFVFLGTIGDHLAKYHENVLSDKLHAAYINVWCLIVAVLPVKGIHRIYVHVCILSTYTSNHIYICKYILHILYIHTHALLMGIVVITIVGY